LEEKEWLFFKYGMLINFFKGQVEETVVFSAEDDRRSKAVVREKDAITKQSEYLILSHLEDKEWLFSNTVS
jgi:hypothetical protein